jgi:hypothetical protein
VRTSDKTTFVWRLESEKTSGKDRMREGRLDERRENSSACSGLSFVPRVADSSREGRCSSVSTREKTV